MNINWKVRIANKTFWLTLIPALLLLLQAVASVFGYNIQINEIGNKLIEVVNALFVVFAIVGVVADPTTKGISDSIQALTYKKPSI